MSENDNVIICLLYWISGKKLLTDRNTQFYVFLSCSKLYYGYYVTIVMLWHAFYSISMTKLKIDYERFVPDSTEKTG